MKRNIVIAFFVATLAVLPAAAQDDFWTQLEAEAVEEWRWPAEQGDPAAQYNLGLAYMNGYGVMINLREAVKWYRRAADQGMMFAQSNLGRMYNNGFGVERDDVQAHLWFDLAADQGDPASIANRDRIARRLSPAERAEAARLADAWRAEHSH